MQRRVDKRSVPDQSRRHLLGVPGKMNLLRKARRDAARREPFDKIAIDDRAIGRLEFNSFPLHAGRHFRLPAVTQIRPDRFDLNGRIAAKNVRNDRTTSRPRRRHSSPRTVFLRIKQIAMEPVVPQSARHCGQIQRLKAGRRERPPSPGGGSKVSISIPLATATPVHGLVRRILAPQSSCTWRSLRIRRASENNMVASFVTGWKWDQRH